MPIRALPSSYSPALFKPPRNPFYKNEKKTVEPHLLHTFVEDFYGEILAISIVGYLRPELDYTTLEALKEAIAADITLAKNNLEGMEKPASLTEA